MTTYYQDESVVLHHGDCLDVLPTLEAASVHAVVTDPPYELGFMGKTWDARGVAFDPETWRQVLRVLKPGGYLLAFGGSRTFHRLACAIEDAGFEIRDSISWIYGVGFPKSLSPYRKLIPCQSTDAAPHAVRLSKWLPLESNEAREPTALALAETLPEGNLAVLIRTGEADGSHALTVTSWSDWTRADTNLNTVSLCRGYSADSWQPTSMSITSTMIAAITDPRTSNSCRSLLTAAFTRSPATGQHGCGCVAATVGTRSTGERWTWQLTPTLIAPEPAIAPLAPLRGLGTATKPAVEPIVVARKPLVGTVASNVLEHGTGALNIDACRVPGEPWTFTHGPKTGRTGGGIMGDPAPREGVAESHPAGRWPTNVVLDESQAAELDRQSGVLTSGANPTTRGADQSRVAYGDFAGQREVIPARGADAGGASRFFPKFRYEAKADTAERPTVNGVSHPTVKPIALMQWLVRLVTPPGGTVLEPFAGSGTTVEAAVREGFQCIAIEREADYLPLIVSRLERPINHVMEFPA